MTALVGATGFDPAVFSLNNANLVKDPYPAYEWMRQNEPAFYSPIFGGSWSFFRYEDVSALLLSYGLTTYRPALPLEALPPREREPFMAMVEVIKYWMAFYGGGEHNVRRRHLRRIWEMLGAQQLVPRIQVLIDGLLDAIGPAAAEVDLVTEFARPLPAMAIADLVGVPVADHARLTEWADALAYLFGSSEILAEDAARANDAVRNFVSYFTELRCTTLQSGVDTMLHRLCTWETDGFQFSEIEVYAQCILLMFAGITPARHIIANSVHALAKHPGEQQRLRSSPKLMTSALEELLRYDTPVQFIGRRGIRDFSYRGNDIRAGQPVLLYAASANRDSRVFVDPDALILDRTPNRHLSFGYGPHFCIGAALVRLQTELALTALLRRLPTFELVDPIRARRNSYLGFHGFAELPVILTGHA